MSEFIWAEKYRPKSVNDVILPDRLKTPFLNMVKNGKIPNLLLTSSTPGTGKTTIARALCHDLDYEVFFINGSKDRNKDLLPIIDSVAKTKSLENKRKAIIIDEADGLNNQSVQPALRALIEEYSNVTFILTANYKNKLIEPIHSRCDVIDFSIRAGERNGMMALFLQRVFLILKNENIIFDQKSVSTVVKRFYPDNRRTLNLLQKYSAGGEIDSSIVDNLKNADIDTLVKHIQDKSLGGCRQWVADNSDTDISEMYLELYKKLYELADKSNPDNVLNLIQLMADYQFKATAAVIQEINTLGLISAIIQNIVINNE